MKQIIATTELAQQVVDLQNFYTIIWHQDPGAKYPDDDLLSLIAEQHKQNFDLWHEEDIARDRSASDGTIAQVKRNIDGFNQRRNDLITEVDESLADGLLAEYQNDSLPWNSETLGSIIDRLSIASLKEFHMREQTEREDASAEHIRSCQEKLDRLLIQNQDLATSLQQFVNDIVAEKKQNKLYRQFKMYNDPSLNPRIYKKSGQ